MDADRMRAVRDRGVVTSDISSGPRLHLLLEKSTKDGTIPQSQASEVR